MGVGTSVGVAVGVTVGVFVTVAVAMFAGDIVEGLLAVAPPHAAMSVAPKTTLRANRLRQILGGQTEPRQNRGPLEVQLPTQLLLAQGC